MSENENGPVLWRNRLLIAAATLVAALAVIVVRPPEMSHDAVIQAGYEAIHSIAVLPLENLSGDPQQDYFADGLTAELITNLGKVSALRVISPNSELSIVSSFSRSRCTSPPLCSRSLTWVPVIAMPPSPGSRRPTTHATTI